MATDLKDLVRQFKAAPRALKIVAVVLALDLLVPAALYVALGDDVDAALDRIQQVEGQLATLRKKVADTRREIARLPDLKARYDRAMSKGVFAPQNRLKLVQFAEDGSAQFRLGGLHYKLSAEDVKPITGSKYQTVTTEIAFDQGALLDTDVLAFWEEFLSQLPAHYHVTAATLTRDRTLDAAALADIRAGRPVSLVKADLVFRWVSVKAPEPTKAPEKGK